MSTNLKQFTQDTADRLRMTIGSTQYPANVTGGTVRLRTRRTADGVPTEALATVTNPGGPVVSLERAWQAGELPAPGASFTVEAIVTYANTEIRTYPGADQPTLVADVAPRRTT